MSSSLGGWQARRCDVLFSRLYPTPAVLFLCCMVRDWHANRKWCLEPLFEAQRGLSDIASLSGSRMVQAFDGHSGSCPYHLCFGLCNCYYLWWYSRSPRDVTAVHMCLHLESKCNPLKSLLILTTRCAAKSRWWKTSSDTNGVHLKRMQSGYTRETGRKFTHRNQELFVKSTFLSIELQNQSYLFLHPSVMNADKQELMILRKLDTKKNTE